MVSNAFVILTGMGTVFFGLICLVAIIKIVGAVVQAVQKPQEEKAGPAVVQQVPVVQTPAADKSSAVVAAVIAAVMEELGEDPARITVTKIG